MNRNPFIIRGMIKSDRNFWGRTTETADVYSWLLDSEEQPQSVAIVGQRRIGTSSLLYRIYKQRAADEIYVNQLKRTVCVMLTIQGLANSSSDQFFARVLEELDHGETALSEIIHSLKSQLSSDPEECLRRCLRWMDQESILLVLILDEFESAAHNSSFDKVFFDKLRSLAQEWRLAFVIATHHDLDKLWDPSLVSSPFSSPFFNFFQTLTLKGFHHAETINYLKAVSGSAGFSFRDSEVEIIQQVGGNHPFFLNVAAYHIFQRLSQQNEAITFDSAKMLAQTTQDPAIYGNLRYYWQNLTPLQRQVLSTVAEGKLAQPFSADISVDLTWLERMSLLERLPDGSYVLFSNVFRKFVLDTIRSVQAKSRPPDSKEISQDVSALVAQVESAALEFKSSLRWDYRQEKEMDHIETAAVKTIAAFLNTDSGTLIIGIDDQSEILGLEKDYQTLKKQNRDGFELHLMQLVSRDLGKEFCQYIQLSFPQLGDREICIVVTERSPIPVFMGKERVFYIRTGNSTQQLNPEQIVRYCELHWK